MKDTTFSSNFSLNCKGKLTVYKHPIVMGTINATPDSFYSKSRQLKIEDALISATEMIDAGAEIIDIGGYSSRPGAEDISVSKEIERVTPIIREIRHKFPNQIISIDTFRTDVAEAAINAGATVINDISGGQNNISIYQLAASEKTPYIMMHMRGTPKNMQSQTDYKLLTSDLINYFSNQIEMARKEGLIDIILDVGIGFSKTTNQNYTLLKHLKDFSIFGLPILLGISRKSLIYKTLNVKPDDALNGTTVLNTIGLMNGANILRVHDVREAKEAIKLYSKIL